MSPYPLRNSTASMTRIRSSKLSQFCAVPNSPMILWLRPDLSAKVAGKRQGNAPPCSSMCAKWQPKAGGCGGRAGGSKKGHRKIVIAGLACAGAGNENAQELTGNLAQTYNRHPVFLQYPAPAASGFVQCAPKPPLRTRNDHLPTAAPTPRPRSTRYYTHSNIPPWLLASYLLRTARNAT